MRDRNENRPGYKKTKVGWIPEDWDCSPQSEGITLISGQHVKAKYCSDIPPGIPYITGPSCIINGKIIQHSYTTVPTRMCQRNDILITVKGSGTGSIAKADQSFCISRQIMAVRSIKWSHDFLYCRFAHDSKLYKNISDGLIPGISREDILKKVIPVPPRIEQEKIAEILSTWDKTIDQTRKLIDSKKRLKKGLMQQLVSNCRNKKILKEIEWEMRPLGELIEPVTRPTPKPNEPYLSIGIRSHGKGTFQKIIKEPEKVMMDTLYRLEADDLLVNITFAWEGAIAIATEKDTGGFVSHRFPMYRVKKTKVDLDYLRNLILTKRFVWDLGLISPGGAGRNRVMNQRDFLKMSVPVPPIEAQTKIGKILMDADKDIKLCEKYLNSLEKQKRGVMQILLTGEIRVKT